MRLVAYRPRTVILSMRKENKMFYHYVHDHAVLLRRGRGVPLN